MLHYELPSDVPSREREGFSAHDVYLPAHNGNLAEIRLTSRYPESGFARNTKSEMIVRVLEGSVTFVCEGERVELPTGSTVLVERYRTYHWEPTDSALLLVFSSPAWSKEQHEHIPA